MNIDKAERSVLGSMLLSRAAVNTVTEMLRPDDFQRPEHREIFADMLTLALGGKPVDLVTLDAELERRGKLNAIGGPAYIVQLSRSVPSAVNAEAYAQEVLEAANLRRLDKLADAIKRKVATGGIEADKLIEMVEGACYDITQRKKRGGGWITLGDAMLEAYLAAENPTKAIPTGFAEVDDMLCGGMRGSALFLVGARPGKGKSSFMLAVALHAAQLGKQIGFVSLEMPHIEIAQRSQAAASAVSITKQRRGGDALNEADWDAMNAGLQRFKDLGIADRFHIYDGYSMTVERLGNIARHAVAQGEMDLLVVDYLQILGTTERIPAVWERLGEISRGLKLLAMELDIPILAAVQVTRQGKEDARRGGRAPTLDELRGSGSLEQDADTVMLIHSPESEEDATLSSASGKHSGIWARALFKKMTPMTVEVAKQRQGATGRTWCFFRPDVMRFVEDTGE